MEREREERTGINFVFMIYEVHSEKLHVSCGS